MTRMTQVLPLTCAAALLVMSAPASAQTTTQPPQTTATARVTTTQNAGQALMDARKALNTVLNAPAPNEALFAKLNSIKTHYLELEKAYSTRGDWQTHYTAINETISELTDGATATGTASTSTATTGATGTSGTAAVAKLDTAAVNGLQAFRKALSDFSVAMGGAPAKSAATPGATGTTGTATVTAATGGTPPTASATVTTATPPAAQPPAAGVATPADPDVAELARLIVAALSSTATAAGADTVCVDRKTLQDMQARIAVLAAKKPQ